MIISGTILCSFLLYCLKRATKPRLEGRSILCIENQSCYRTCEQGMAIWPQCNTGKGIYNTGWYVYRMFISKELLQIPDHDWLVLPLNNNSCAFVIKFRIDCLNIKGLKIRHEVSPLTGIWCDWVASTFCYIGWWNSLSPPQRLFFPVFLLFSSRPQRGSVRRNQSWGKCLLSPGDESRAAMRDDAEDFTRGIEESWSHGTYPLGRNTRTNIRVSISPRGCWHSLCFYDEEYFNILKTSTAGMQAYNLNY